MARGRAGGGTATVELPIPQPEHDDVRQPDRHRGVDEGTTSAFPAVEQGMEELAERDHVGDGGERDQRDADDAEPFLLLRNTSGIGNEEDYDQRPLEGGDKTPVPESSNETVGQDELERHGGQDRQQGGPAGLTGRRNPPGDNVVSAALRRVI